ALDTLGVPGVPPVPRRSQFRSGERTQPLDCVVPHIEQVRRRSWRNPIERSVADVAGVASVRPGNMAQYPSDAAHLGVPLVQGKGARGWTPVEHLIGEVPDDR